MVIAIDDPAPCEVCGRPAVTVLVDGRERRLCRDHLPDEALAFAGERDVREEGTRRD